VIERFGDSIQGFYAFPSPERLAQALIGDLVACGLSNKKAEYIHVLAEKIAVGSMDLEDLKQRSDDEVRSFIMAMHGFGRWSADYILVRGLGRPDCVPAEDLAVRTVAGRYLGKGQRMTAAEVQKALKPFTPYRGLAAFYLLADSRS
jgi:DNA-3-methyladenine glycosylase II